VPATIAQDFPKPPLPRPSADLVKAGKVHFEAGLCASCHGTEVESARSSIPDLRLATAQTHAQFAAIVLGARRHKGMPAFPTLSLDQIKAIQAYVLDEAWSTYEAQQATSTQRSAR
jgi:mono/diheme cytochrome c family protein